MPLPLVSCIMPTHNRRKFIPQAIDCFLSQTHPNKELVIANTGQDWIVDLVPASDAIRLFECVASKPTVGGIRNYCCTMARGLYVAHVDDDDWSHPDRLSEQIALLEETGKAVTGYHSITFEDMRDGAKWEYSGDANYACGTSLMYRRDFWRRHPFPDVRQGEDNALVAAAVAEDALIATDGRHRIIAREHDGCTSPRRDWFAIANCYRRVA